MSSNPSAAHRLFLEEDNLQDTAGAREVLVRVTVAKVLDVEQARKILRSLDPRREEKDYTCFTWVREAFGILHDESGCLKSYFTAEDWMSVERSAREYAKQKRQEGRFVDDTRAWSETEICTYNAWERRETTA